MVFLEKDKKGWKKRNQSIPLAFAVGETFVASWYFRLNTSRMLFDLNQSDTLILLYLPGKAIISGVQVDDHDWGRSSEN